MKKLFSLFYAIALCVTIAFAGEPLRVLAIGNSFSVDAAEQYLHSVADGAGQNIVIGNLYIGGCSLDRHFDNITNDKPDYSYRKIGADGRADTVPDCTLRQGLLDEPWDVITFQQASHFSGQYETYSHLPELISMVRDIVGEHPRFLWHMTWAYSTDSEHSGFKNYGTDQLQMYEAIVDVAKRIMNENKELTGIIPCGTAIQDARTSEIRAAGRELTRDGYHLDRRLGRYIASCTWFGVLFDDPTITTTFIPARVTDTEARLAREAARAAILHPFTITPLR